jgi:signal peptidase II
MLMKKYSQIAAIASIAFILDQISKYWVLRHLFGFQGDIAAGIWHPPIPVTPFFNWVMVWNRGVSFGLLRHHSEWMPYALSVLAAAIVIGLLVWVRQHSGAMVIWAVGLVSGGAIGNIIDRLTYGAVADFLDFHLFDRHYPAFNVADSCIVVGVMILLVQSWWQSRASKIEPPATTTQTQE